MFSKLGEYERVDLKQEFKKVSDRDNFIDLLTKMLHYIPEKRITAKEALLHPYFQGMKQKVADDTTTIAESVKNVPTKGKSKEKVR